MYTVYSYVSCMYMYISVYMSTTSIPKMIGYTNYLRSSEPCWSHSYHQNKTSKLVALTHPQLPKTPRSLGWGPDFLASGWTAASRTRAGCTPSQAVSRH